MVANRFFGFLILMAPLMAVGDDDAVRAANLAFVDAWHATNRETAAKNANGHVLPRVVVDQAAHTLTFIAEATGIEPREPVEFFLIGENSGNAYEAIAVALADPAQIDAGIRMLGLPPGSGIDPAATRFWSKGERVIMTFNGIRAERLIRDSRTGKTLAQNGFVYTGSQQIPTDDGTGTALAAQVRPPYSVASNYNEPDSLLDVPWQAPQTAVYSHQVLNPDFLFKPGERIKVIIRPEYTDGKRRVQDLRLEIGIGGTADDAASTIADARFSLENRTTDTRLLEATTIDRLLGRFTELIDDGHTPFVVISIRPEASLGVIHQTASILKSIDTEKGIRIEPPPAGNLYYQAFTPNETFRHRHDRYIQPWELRLDGSGTGVLTRIDEHWTRGKLKPELTTTNITVESAEHLQQVLTTQKPDVGGVYVFAQPSLTYGALMHMIKPILPTHPHIHIYLDKQPSLKTPPSALTPPNPDPPVADRPSSS